MAKDGKRTRELNDIQRQILIQNHGSLEKVIDHISGINSFILQALTFADRNSRADDTQHKDFLFHEEMNRLTRKAGLRG